VRFAGGGGLLTFIHTFNTGRAAYTGIPRRWHAIVMRRLHQTRSGPVSFSILRLLRPRRCRFRGAAGEVLITASSRAVRRCGTIVVLLTSRRRRRRGPGRLQQPRGSRATPRRGSEAFVATSAASGGRALRGVHFTPSMQLGTPFLGAGYLAAHARAHCSHGTTTSSMRPALGRRGDAIFSPFGSQTR
jgi:hypothetical protein